MSELKFNVVFEDAGDGWVYAHMQELPEVHTQGEGLDAARAMVREAIELSTSADATRAPAPTRSNKPAKQTNWWSPPSSETSPAASASP